MLRRLSLLLLGLLLSSIFLSAQTPSEMAGVLERLERLERQNRELSAEVQTLRAELASVRSDPPAQAAAATAPAEQRLDIQEQRIEEQAQSKVEASQRFPIRLTGMALFNAFLDSRQNGGSDYPTIASAPGPGRAGATVVTSASEILPSWMTKASWGRLSNT